MTAVLADLLTDAARRYPGNLAVIEPDRRITYAGLDERADRLARMLIARGVRPGDRVGLHLDKSIEAVVGIHAVLRAGAVYVPLDPDGPPVRLAMVAEDCAIRLLVTSARLRDRWAGDAAPELVVLDPDGPAGPAPPGDPYPRPEADDPAYILYTSGSTGRPKGVTLTHANALSFVRWAARVFGVGPEDRLANFAPLHFDLSIFDLFVAAGAGAAVVLVPQRTALFPPLLRRLLRDAGVTIWYSVPSTLAMLVDRDALRAAELPALRAILFAGEVFPPRHLGKLVAALPGVRFANLYGPTETNVCTWYELPRDQDGPVVTDPLPIGTPIDGVGVRIVTDAGTPADDGETGELVVHGPTVMRGYWGDPARTAAAFDHHPSMPGPGYRTGDLVRRDADGLLRFVGRRDSQIKSRGYRIELGEVEAALNRHPDLVECAVTAVPDELVTNRLKAYVVWRSGSPPDDFSAFCAARLPGYMIPSEVVAVDRLPRTTTGKIDRRRL